MLSGQTVLITRATEPGNDRLGPLLAKLGAKLVYSPVIEITAPKSWDAVDRAIRRIHEFGALVFLSASGVSYFFDRLEQAHSVNSILEKEHVAIGRGTKVALNDWGIEPSLMPGDSHSSALAQMLIENRNWAPFLIPRGNRGSDVLPNALAASDVPFEQVVVYQSQSVVAPDPSVVEQLANGSIDWVCATSTSIAEVTAQLYGEHLQTAKIACISPAVGRRLKEVGYAATVEAVEHNFQGLVDAIGAFDLKS